MTRIRYSIAGVIGALLSLPLIGISFVAEKLADLPFLPFDFFDWLARVLPGDLITVGIDSLVFLIRRFDLGPTSSTAKAFEQTIALGQFILVGAGLAVILAYVHNHTQDRLLPTGWLAGLALTTLAVLIEFDLASSRLNLAAVLWIGMLGLAFGRGMAGALRRYGQISPEADEASFSRRQFLAWLGAGAVGGALAALGLGRWLGGTDGAERPQAADFPGLAEGELGLDPTASAELSSRIEPAPGTRPELTSNQDFYRIDINTRPPTIEASQWSLELEGLVHQPLSLTLEEIANRPAVTQVITLQCISNPIGGDLTSTSAWTGVPFKAILESAGLRAGAKEISMEAADGFYESVSLQDAMDERTLLVYAMNGEPLPVEHGFPLRIYIPDRYGMKQPKWITRMEVIDQEGPGYWVDRGWSEEAFVRTTSVIDSVAVEAMDEASRSVPVGGIAYAGARGISKVEVQVDDGPWVAAQLRLPALSPLAWVQWRYDWPYQSGRHTFRVRAYDGTGALQDQEPRDARPDGATGVHSLTLRV